MENEEKISRIKSDFKQMAEIRAYWDKGIWQDIANYVLPLREDLTGNEQKGRRKGAKSYDGTAISALNIASDGTHGYTISPALKWFVPRLPAQLRFLEKVPEVRLWMESLSDGVFTAFQNSNFYSEMRMFLRDGFGIGTSSIFIDEDIKNNRLIFHTLHPREGFIAENAHRQVDKFIRFVKLTARQAVQQFGTSKISQPIKNAYQSAPEKEFEFLHYVAPREEYDNRLLGNINKPFASIWIEKTGNAILRESGFDMFPYVVWRYSMNSDGPYGDSPATYALPEIKGLNIIKKSIYGAAQMTIEPPYNVPAEMKGKVRLTPHGMNYYGSDPSRTISPVNTGITFPISIEMKQEISEIIKKHFHVDFFTMLSQAERQMTIIEVTERLGEKASILGASIGDLFGVYDDIIDYVAHLEMRAGRIPMPPDILMQYAGGLRIDTVYTGILAQAQRKLFETQSIRSSLDMAIPYFQAFPETMDIINADKTLRDLMISNGFPESDFATMDEVSTKRKARSDAQGMETQKMDMERMSDVLKKLAMADKQSGGKLSAQIDALLGGGGVQNPALLPEELPV